MIPSDDTAVSPVVASILVVAVTVLLAVSVFVFVMDTTENTPASVSSYSSFSASDGTYSSTVVDAGSAERLTYQLNGEPLVTVDDPANHVGSDIELTQYSQFCAGDELTVIGGSSGDGTVLQTESITEDVNCNLPNTSATSEATYNGESWIVNTTLLNRGDSDREYIIILTNGDDYEILDTTTVSATQTTVVSGSSSTFDSNDDVSVGVLSPSSGGDGHSLTSSGGSYGWSGGPSAGHSFYTPYSPSTSYSSSSSSSSSGSGTASGTDASFASPDREDGTGALALSSSRVAPGEPIDLYATLATTKAETDETLVVYATRTNPTTEEKARSTYTLTAESHRNVTETFSIDEPGEYVISASLVGSEDIYTAGTITVVESLGVSLDSASVSASTVDAGTPVSVSATLSNSGSSEAIVTAEFFRDGNVYAEQDVTLSAGETTTIDASSTLSDIGDYQFHVGLPETAALTHAGNVSAEDPSAVDVSISASPNPAYVGEAVEFSATTTHESNTEMVEYQWTFGDGETVTTESATVSHTYSTPSEPEYSVRAVAADGEQNTAGNSVTVIDEPQASASASESSVYLEDTVEFSAEGTQYSGDATFDWEFGDETSATGTVVSHSYETEGTYQATLTVTEPYGKSDTATVSVTATQSPTEEGLVAHWTFDEGTGATASDSSEYSHDGSVSSGATWTSDAKVGSHAIDLSGSSNAYVQNANRGDLSISKEVTMSAWVYVRGEGDSSWNRYVTYDDANDNQMSLHWDADDDRYGFSYGGNGESAKANVTGKDIPQGEWVHMVGTYDGESVKFYENGEMVVSRPLSTTFEESNSYLTVGQRSDIASDHTNARVDDVRVYNRAFDESDVTVLFEETR